MGRLARTRERERERREREREREIFEHFASVNRCQSASFAAALEISYMANHFKSVAYLEASYFLNVALTHNVKTFFALRTSSDSFYLFFKKSYLEKTRHSAIFFSKIVPKRSVFLSLYT